MPLSLIKRKQDNLFHYFAPKKMHSIYIDLTTGAMMDAVEFQHRVQHGYLDNAIAEAGQVYRVIDEDVLSSVWGVYRYYFNRIPPDILLACRQAGYVA